MILAAYRNPPYRSPTPRMNSNSNSDNNMKAASLSPPPPAPQRVWERRSQSPKRKREGSISELSATTPSMLSVATSAISHEDVAVESGADSPRTKVAERFRGLEVGEREDGGVGSSQSPRKKVKRMVGGGDGEVSTPVVQEGYSSSIPRELEIPDSEGPRLLEMAMAVDRGGEEEEANSPSPSPTPVPSAQPPQHQQQRRTLTKVPSLIKESSYLSTRSEPTISIANAPTSSPPTTTSTTAPSKRRLSSPPPPPSSDPTPLPTLESMTQTQIPLTSSTNQSHLTWQTSEITGHDIDASNPDDDGEGINGIGFKPTPAMAHARSLKRKKQVEEWKTREAREARQRRLERRKRGVGTGGISGGDDAGEGMGKRVVRFVDG